MSNEIIKQWGSKSLHLVIYCAFLFPLIVMLYPLTNTWDASFNKVLGAIPFLFETYFPFVVGKAIWMHICIELAFVITRDVLAAIPPVAIVAINEGIFKVT